MKYAIAAWIAPLVVVKVDEGEFDGPLAAELERRLADHFRGASFAIITSDPKQVSRIRARGLAVPHDVMTDPSLVWHELALPPEPEAPF